ncbi:hypothetical protein GCM10010363_60850 [Streptomyces omiyaensis]|uniref:hypothetical protein n=1 Tax=Streptomyces omiyaensis TaxID=68247 RepID=UPI00167534E6|nr:hypothetical protein [Streptomyces omiyaensis]GGY71378.1 hypothetical protein GCM10010363_60850 [Streptomyces omiyaensis]
MNTPRPPATPCTAAAKALTGRFPTRAAQAVDTFLASLGSASTRRQRKAFLDEYLAWTAEAHDRPHIAVTTAALLEEENVARWLHAAAQGHTRRRNSSRGPRAEASQNSMAARVSTVNAFSAYYGRPLALRPPAGQFAPRLTSDEARRALQKLTEHKPVGILQTTWERSAAVIAAALATGEGLAALHPLRRDDLDLDHRPPRIHVRDTWHPITDETGLHTLERWARTHQALTSGHLKELKGGDVHQLWVTTAPGRPRGDAPAPPAGLPATIRTLESAHRKLTATVLGSPLLLEQFCPAEPPQDAPPA